MMLLPPSDVAVEGLNPGIDHAMEVLVLLPLTTEESTTPPTRRVLHESRPKPVIVTKYPPAVGPRVGLMEKTSGHEKLLLPPTKG